MRTLLSSCFLLVILAIGTTCFAQPVPLDPGQLGTYSGKATLTYFNLVEAKPIKFKGVITMTVHNDSSVSISMPTDPYGTGLGQNCVAKLSATGGIAYYSGGTIKMSAGTGLKGTNDKASATLNGSVTFHDSFLGNVTTTFMVKKLKKIPL